MLLGLSWPWWVLAGVAAYGVVRIAALVAAAAADVRGEPAAPASPGWFRPHLVVLPAGWVLLGGFAAGAAAYSAVSILLGPGDRDLSRMLGAAAAVIGFLVGAIVDVRLALWTRRSLVPRLIARELSQDRESLELGDEPDRLHAARRMARMGGHAAPAIELLTSAAQHDPSADVRLAAWEALSNLVLAGAPLPTGVPLASLDDPDVRVRTIAACHAVRVSTGDGTNRPGIEPTREELAALGEGVLLADSIIGPVGEPLAEIAARALAELGAFAEPAVPALQAAVCDRSPPNVAAITALTKTGPAAVPALVEMLVHPEPEIRREAADMLGWMGKEASDAVPALRAMRDAYPEDADWAEFAIEMIEHS
jgi:HEAT repeat protein